ncbi:MAG: hypothetical protein CRU78_02195 [Candidatus Accumulibacter phosphatis]|uniref:GGDEF domain-containing protein n=1 Tax=Candidatus Accumulibacter phosphatis TaxID=327160 RepID=A0A6A7RQ31_9PROT|nr:hypothetical protein [Candidatus Accumulibacter phosphatis]
MAFFTTISVVAIALYPDNGENAELPIRKADIAMYQIKGRGKNGYLQFTQANANPSQLCYAST